MVRRLVKFLLKTFSARGWIIAWVFWLIVLCWLSSLPQSKVHLPAFQNSDKVAHFFYFAAGAGIFTAFLRVLGSPIWQTFVFTLLAMALVGAADEFHQLYTPGRSGADIGDWTADVSGAFLGILLTLFIFRNSGKPKKEN
jgi:VanZ family protein